ncbi:RidA family protein [Blastococcus tunisiensis]|uniref:Enamine deaminase RidA, house cleaning of reactive enamine intermediates, YjgF/YER057c/UK114 family n=1 Tax=Blastococcus tunisiensis TaxID=1798228 RepID=A0A1I2FSS5_9ACTN|nr:RidA family protein [Blastococcus sp. DSM 46838]SFF07919.1 Enamine deaminase RidA, house cleaning of reactive enamine intermediates, YjgF/YER057c/UK114 family [Blastococcus sp. DSM 46838]
MTLNRTAVNPWQWSVDMGFNQAELVTGATRVLVCSGQTAMSAEGRPQHAGDMAAQVAMALDNLEAVLAGGDMGLGNVVQLNIYTTDVDAFFACYGSVVERFRREGVKPTSTLLGISRLAFPELMVELEATAVA